MTHKEVEILDMDPRILTEFDIIAKFTYSLFKS
ncbi:hypothetical protein HNR41_001142 [Jeotgalicoccus coquinae]|uniref:Uncharacterized protein n=1 Tax=Jeotgalicoccus coquinae TaxID=709509 RepID=A0A6V7RTX5_9STAP|nr:hypothetical protein [Jeotgalicoccus coquinae]CAD2081934.1 hypothetical protein JEOCOQ751_02241 [Jeotgalicoccus coquinae]